MNRICLVGRLTAKPELRYTQSNLAFTRFNLAVKNRLKNDDGTYGADFISIVCWRKQAENVCNYLDKGSQVSVEGRLQTNNYEDRDGNKRYSMEVVADSVQFLESKSQCRTNDESPYDYQSSSNNQYYQNDPFQSFGEQVSLRDEFLD